MLPFTPPVVIRSGFRVTSSAPFFALVFLACDREVKRTKTRPGLRFLCSIVVRSEIASHVLNMVLARWAAGRGGPAV